MEEKQWWKSRALWSLVVAVGCLIAGAFGFEVDEQTKQLLIDNTTAIASGVGILFGIISGAIFRIKAKDKLIK